MEDHLLERIKKNKYKLIFLLILIGIGLLAVYALTFRNIINIDTSSPTDLEVIKKPAIYLYPTETSEIEVKVDVNGFITKSEPKYLSGWKVIAEPNGLIDNRYDYLFYEAQLKNLQLPDEGWIIKYSDLDKWFDETLPFLGLNNKEIDQFKEYWMKELPKANYYEMKILDNQFLNKNMKLIVNPKPDTMIRVIFYFKPLSEKIEIKEPTIKTPQRTGFTVVEWGGLLDNRTLL